MQGPRLPKGDDERADVFITFILGAVVCILILCVTAYQIALLFKPPSGQ